MQRAIRLGGRAEHDSDTAMEMHSLGRRWIRLTSRDANTPEAPGLIAHAYLCTASCRCTSTCTHRYWRYSKLQICPLIHSHLICSTFSTTLLFHTVHLIAPPRLSLTSRMQRLSFITQTVTFTCTLAYHVVH